MIAWVLAILAGILLAAVPLLLYQKLPDPHPNSAWITADATITGSGKRPNDPNQEFPLVRYQNPGSGVGTAEVLANYPAKPGKYSDGSAAQVLLDPLNPVLPFILPEWNRRLLILKVVAGACWVLAAVAITYGVVGFVTQ